jgi:hypothetical protein
MSTSIPHSSKNFVTWRCPRYDAKWNGVLPSLSRADTAAPLLDQEARYFEVPKPRCKAQGSLLLVIPAVNICATDRSATLQCRGVRYGTRDAAQSSDLLSVHSHRRRGLSRTVRGQGIHTVTRDAEESNFASRVRSHQSRSLAIAVRRQHVHFVTQHVMDYSRFSSRELMSEPRSIRKCAMSGFPYKQESSTVSLASYSEHRDLHQIQVAVPQSHDTPRIALPRVAGPSLHRR